METYNQETVLEQDLLTDLDNQLVHASTGKRFANYIIDVIVFYVFAFAVGIVWALVSPDSVDALDDNSGGTTLLTRLVALIAYALLMGAIEAIFKGKTLGKAITGTRAVNEDGTLISAKTAFARGFSRAVPFCVFSAFGSPCYPWQDRWTNTLVIDERQSNR